MTAKYQVYKDMEGKFRFRLRAANNKIVAVSEAYESKASCINGIKSVQSNCESHIEDKTKAMEKITNPKYEIFTDAADEFRFHLKASNGEIIAASEGYETKEGVLNGIEAVQRSCGAEIEDLTVEQATELDKEDCNAKVTIESITFYTIGEICKAPTPGLNNTVLMLDDVPTAVKSDTTITFTGRLKEHDTDEGVGCAQVYIYEHDRSFMRDDFLASGTTDNDGAFSIDWVAKQKDFWDDKVQVYAMFRGAEHYNPSKSDIKHVRVLWFAKDHLKEK
ncbi:MAG: DUF1508 domain-containing protein [archaeon]|nr:DUF1508 domain-containing protein [Candidatus Bathyarchaeum sp.]